MKQNAQTAMKFQPIISSYQNKTDYHNIDLSKDTLMKRQVDASSPESLTSYLDKTKSQTGAKVLYGGYLERRSLYDEKSLFQKFNQQRNIHLGVDFWADAGENILCPIIGEIHSFADNTGFGNYGPCIILKHQNNKDVFYTLYGHLSRKSLNSIKVGQSVKQHQVFCSLGTAEENGGYVPHLHFQIIKDIQDYTGDYPGVCNQAYLEFYKNNTINPIDFLDLLI